jgi:hypothetical protein
VLRRNAGMMTSPPLAQLADQLKSEGYLTLAPGYSPELLATLKDALSLADDPASSVATGGRIKESVRYVLDPLSRVPRLRELLTPELVDVLHAWYRSDFRIDSVRMWRIAHVPPAEQVYHHYGNLWHVDGHALDTMKLFVQVSPDATRSGSAFRLLSRHDTRRAFRLGYVDPRHIHGPARGVLDTQPIYFDGPPGDVAFVDTNRCLHRAGVPEDGQTRGMVQIIFKSSSQGPSAGDYFADVPVDKNVFDGAIA